MKFPQYYFTEERGQVVTTTILIQIVPILCIPILWSLGFLKIFCLFAHTSCSHLQNQQREKGKTTQKEKASTFQQALGGRYNSLVFNTRACIPSWGQQRRFCLLVVGLMRTKWKTFLQQASVAVRKKRVMLTQGSLMHVIQKVSLATVVEIYLQPQTSFKHILAITVLLFITFRQYNAMSYWVL